MSLSSTINENPEDYTLLNLLQENSSFAYYKGIHSYDQTSVILKLVKNEMPTQTKIRSIQYEMELTQSLQMEEIMTPRQIISIQGTPALVFPDHGQVPLWHYLLDHPVEISTFLQLAIGLVHIVNKLHQKGIIHADIRPQHLFVDPIHSTMVLTGLESSIQHNHQLPHPLLTNFLIQERLPYMSPEQTGRMQRTMDFRSDIYSMGAVFYEMITGQLLFQERELVEWVYAHIAKEPQPPAQLRQDLPMILSNIIMKCLSKSCDERYQSAYGLLMDLQACLDPLESGFQMSEFPLGLDDRMPVFELPQKLYGREQERSDMLALFERVCHGSNELLLISGYSGIGKTTLVHEIRKPLFQSDGYFISGKCSQMKNTIPYDPLLQAFKQLIHLLLMESEEKLNHWRHKIIEELGPNISIIVDVLPDIELMIGKQPKVQPLQGIELQNRFFLTFQKFARLFCQEDQPLVIFLDDLHWGDGATLRMLQTLLSDSFSHHMMIIGTYSDNEMSDDHSIFLTVQEMKAVKLPVSEIRLAPLSLHLLNQMVKDTLKTEDDDLSEPLSKVIYEKAQGNSFFVKQFLQSIYESSLLEFQEHSGSWKYDLSKIMGQKITDNVADIVIAKFRKLSPRLQQMLSLGACVGYRFDLGTMIKVHGEEDTETLIWIAVKGGILIPQEEVYAASTISQLNPSPTLHFEFLHDKVYDAVYSQLSAEHKIANHQHIGNLFIEQFDHEVPEEMLFEVVHHVNQALTINKSISERYLISKLNWRAGRKSKSASAFDTALIYFNIAIKFMPQEAWIEQREMAFTLFLDCAECNYFSGSYDLAEQRYEFLLDKSASSADKTYVYKQMMLFYGFIRNYKLSIEYGSKALEHFDVHLPLRPSKLAILLKVIQIQWKLRKGQHKDVSNLSLIADRNKEQIMNILSDIGLPAYHVNQNFLGLVITQIIQLTLLHGACDISSSGYINYGLLLSSGFGKYDTGYKIGEMGIELAEKFNNLYLKGRCYFIFGSFIHHWKRPYSETELYMQKALHYCLESGNLHLAGSSILFLTIIQTIRGIQLDAFLEETQHHLNVSEQINYEMATEFLPFVIKYVRILKGKLDLSTEEAQEFFSHDYISGTNEEASSVLPVYNTLRIQVYYYLGEYEKGLALAVETEKVLGKKMVVMIVPEFYFYYALLTTKRYGQMSSAAKKNSWGTLQRILKKIKRWSEHCPANFEHKYLIIKAEMQRISGNDSDAMACYDQALLLAKEHGFAQHAAIINELTGSYYYQKALYKIAKSYLQDAFNDYLAWGALKKVDMLLIHYSSLLLSKPMNNNAPLHLLAFSKEEGHYPISQVIDYSTLVGSFQTITGEMVFDKLL